MALRMKATAAITTATVADVLNTRFQRIVRPRVLELDVERLLDVC